jgi:putative peptidoglycan lipid II flippase
VPLLLVLPAVLPPQRVVAGVMVVTSVTYVAGWVIGDLLLRRRLGSLRSRRTVGPLLRIAVASAAAGVAGELVVRLVQGIAGPTRTGSLVTLLIGTVVIGAAAFAGTLVARVPEIRESLAAARARLGRG